jgi:hypothetical protein
MVQQTGANEMTFTPTQWRVIVAAHMNGDATTADIDSRRVKTRTIAELTARGLLFGPTIEGQIELTEVGETAFWERAA